MPLDATTTLLPPAPPSTGSFKRHEGRAPFFVPSAPYLDRYTTEIWRGMITIRYEVMCLWDPDYLTVTNRDDPLLIDNLIARGHSLIRSARVGSETCAAGTRRTRSCLISSGAGTFRQRPVAMVGVGTQNGRLMRGR